MYAAVAHDIGVDMLCLDGVEVELGEFVHGAPRGHCDFHNLVVDILAGHVDRENARAFKQAVGVARRPYGRGKDGLLPKIT